MPPPSQGACCGDPEEAVSSHSPWSGETVSSGRTATLAMDGACTSEDSWVDVQRSEALSDSCAIASNMTKPLARRVFTQEKVPLGWLRRSQGGVYAL